MGCLMGLEPTAFGTTTRRSNQLSYRHHRTGVIIKQTEYKNKQRKTTHQKMSHFTWYPGRDSTYLRQARNFCFGNKLPREDSLAKCHWHFSPRPFWSGIRFHSAKPMKKPATRTGTFIGTPGGIRTPDLDVRTVLLYPLSYRGIPRTCLLYLIPIHP